MSREDAFLMYVSADTASSSSRYSMAILMFLPSLYSECSGKGGKEKTSGSRNAQDQEVKQTRNAGRQTAHHGSHDTA